jgi:hypothetical protein
MEQGLLGLRPMRVGRLDGGTEVKLPVRLRDCDAEDGAGWSLRVARHVFECGPRAVDPTGSVNDLVARHQAKVKVVHQSRAIEVVECTSAGRVWMLAHYDIAHVDERAPITLSISSRVPQVSTSVNANDVKHSHCASPLVERGGLLLGPCGRIEHNAGDADFGDNRSKAGNSGINRIQSSGSPTPRGAVRANSLDCDPGRTRPRALAFLAPI